MPISSPLSSPVPPGKTTTRFAAYAARFESTLPPPERALRLARLLIPLCMVTGLIVQPLLYWLLPILCSI